MVDDSVGFVEDLGVVLEIDHRHHVRHGNLLERWRYRVRHRLVLVADLGSECAGRWT